MGRYGRPVTDDPRASAAGAGPAAGADLELVHLLRRVTLELDRFGAGFAARYGLGATDLRAVVALLDASRAGRQATPGWLGSQLGINSASVTVLVDRLVRVGYLRRERDDADRRRVHLVVTDDAMELGWTFFGPLIDGVVSVLDGFDDIERDVVRRFLGRVGDVVSDRRLTGTGEPGTPASDR